MNTAFELAEGGVMDVKEHDDYISRVLFWRAWWRLTGEFRYESATAE